MWWMPWRLQAMKDVAACEKLRGAGKRALIRRYPNGETRPLLNRLSCARYACTKALPGQTRLGATGESIEQGSSAPEYIGCRRRTRGTETSQQPEEQKSTEIPRVVASEIGGA